MLTQTESHAQRQFLSISLPFCQCLYSELEGLLTAAWVKQEPQDNIKQVLRGSRARVHARHALKRHCSERMWFREACVWQVEGQQQHVGQGSPTAALKCVWSRHSSCSPFQTLLPTAAPQGFGWFLHGPSQGPHAAGDVRTGACLQPSITFLALSFPLNAHWTSFPTRQARPMCIHLSRTNDLKWRCSLAVTITLTIYSAEANDESRAALQIWKNF